MATLTIRNVDEDLKATLRIRAAMHGQSMEEELRSILRQALLQPPKEGGLGKRLATVSYTHLTLPTILRV